LNEELIYVVLSYQSVQFAIKMAAIKM